MKKLLSLVLTIVMVMSLVVTVTPVSATTSDNLIFSMDLSASTDSKVVVTDSATDSVEETITLPEAGFAVDTVEGKQTKYLKVSAANQAGVKVVDTDVNALGKKDITLEMWTKANSNSATGVANYTEYVFTLHNGSRHNLQYTRSGENVNFDSQYTSSQARVTVTKPEQTEWTHWVITRTYDDTAATGTLTAYKNGVQCGTAPITKEMVDTATSGAMYIGGAASYNATWSNPFVGGIGACNVYGKALSAAEVKAKFTASAEDYYTLDNTGLIFSMDLSESTESKVVVKDKTADVVNETITIPSAGFAVDTVDGKETKYLKVSAANQAGVKVVDEAVNALGRKDVTLEMWTKADSNTATDSTEFVFTLHNGSRHNLKYARNGADVYLENEYTSGYKRVTVTKSEQTEWTHWVLTRTYDEKTNTGTLKAYKNGVKYGADVALDKELADTSTSGAMYIGGAHSYIKTWGNPFVGGIGACNVYNKALTAAEVKAKYDSSAEDYHTLDKTGLVFDMDLSGYSSTSTDAAKGIVDATADLTNETFTLPANISVGPISEGSTINALKLEKGVHGGILASDSGVDAAASSNTMTVETWIKVESDPDHNGGAGHALLYTNSAANHNWQILPVVTKDKTGAINGRHITNTIHKSNTKNHTNMTFDEWAHYVFTREYDTTTQTCTLTFYVNGAQKDRQVLTGISGPQAMSGGLMHIGGGTYNNGAVVMDGEMATFKVYNRVLSESEAFSKYTDSAGGFGHEVPEEGLSVIDLDWTPTEIDAATEDISVDFKVVNTDESKELFCFLAVYDEDGIMVACDVDADVTVGGAVPAVPVSLSVTGLTPAPGYFAKLYVWGKNDIEPFTDGSGKIVYPY